MSKYINIYIVANYLNDGIKMHKILKKQKPNSNIKFIIGKILCMKKVFKQKDLKNNRLILKLFTLPVSLF